MKLTSHPIWIRARWPANIELNATWEILKELNINTVCLSAFCPNIGDCFSRKTATFLILGPTCTRYCRFCAVTKGNPAPVDPMEPKRIAKAAVRLGLRHVVITSVTRDDLPDGGAEHFCETILSIREVFPNATIEVLTPDFGGKKEAIKKVLSVSPNIFNHNIETVPRLYPKVRPLASYQRSLKLLQLVKEIRPGIITKSGIMLGLGENEKEVIAVLKDLRSVGCDIVTIGQYLQPSPAHLPVHTYLAPETFSKLESIAKGLGFLHVSSGPLVRSSYHADNFFHYISSV